MRHTVSVEKHNFHMLPFGLVLADKSGPVKSQKKMIIFQLSFVYSLSVYFICKKIFFNFFS